MDNTSRRYSNEDTTTSMYLSFDAESTMSTACYKTLEAMSDTSNLSAEASNSDGNNQINRTLEGHMESHNVSPLATVWKKTEFLNVKSSAPLKALPNNVLEEYKDLCSTPSKEQHLKTVDVTRSSDTTKCIDLGLAFLGIDDGKPAFFSPNLGTHGENKENVLPDVEEVSSLSTCSSGETTTSVIEKKMCSISNVGSVTEAEPVDGMKIPENVESTTSVIEKKMCSMSNLSSITEAEPADGVKITEKMARLSENNVKYENQIDEINCGLITTNMVDFEIIPKSINEKCTDRVSLINNDECEIHLGDTSYKQTETNREDAGMVFKLNNEKCTEHIEAKKENKPDAKVLEIETKIKPQIALLNRKSRFSVCEPNLQTGKPSRILSSNSQRRSLLPTCTKPEKNMNAEIELPFLINKMLKISNNGNTAPNVKDVNQNSENTKPVDKRRSLMSTMKTRTSLLPAAAGNKRPFNFAHRMSVLVKTTLNSPARKIARRSTVSCATQTMPRKNISQKMISTDSSKFPKVEYALRKSMVPKPTDNKTNTQTNLNNLPPLQGKTINSQRRSLYPLSKTIEKDKFSLRKTDVTYTCSICKENFIIKSLLDAHKRSHETDTSPPAFIKKPSAVKKSLSSTTLGSQNQCKYCDKKFALTKALHIHLLQNCLKIPPTEKRKLQFTDLNHVEKAQLPNVFPNHISHGNSNSASMVSVASERLRYAANKTKNKDAMITSSESLNDKKDKITSDTGNKVKKMSAHAGVYRTPSKTVPCHLCKLTFKSILDYTNHNLTFHGNNKTSACSK